MGGVLLVAHHDADREAARCRPWPRLVFAGNLAATFVAFATEGLMAHNAGPRRRRARERLVPERQPVRADRRRRPRPVAHAARASAVDGGRGAVRWCWSSCALGARRAGGTASAHASSSGVGARARDAWRELRGVLRHARRADWPAARHAANRHRRGAVSLRVARAGVAGLRRRRVADTRSRRRDRHRRRVPDGRLAGGPPPERPGLRHGVRDLGGGRAAPGGRAAHRRRLRRRHAHLHLRAGPLHAPRSPAWCSTWSAPAPPPPR